MTTSASFRDGVLAGLLLAVAAQAVHWFLTPLQHAAASDARRWAVLLQLVMSLALVGWLAARQRQRAL